jgi:drug/metabolite transporter (DMT)-like permease
LLCAVAVGVVWFDEVPDLTMLLGTILIIASLIWLAKVEANKNRIDAETI